MNRVFPDWTDGGVQAHIDTLNIAVRALAEGRKRCDGKPLGAGGPDVIAKQVQEISVLPDGPTDLPEVLAQIGRLAGEYSIDVQHPHTVAHLHCSPTLAALGAEALLSALNQSMDSWDQAPLASHVEKSVVSEMARVIGYTDDSEGVFTSGATQSNLVGLLLARDKCLAAGIDIGRLRIFCSEAAHFSIQRAAHLLGMFDAVVTVAVDDFARMDVEALRTAISGVQADGNHPCAIVATAGTTDLGAIDPIGRIADIATELGIWLHVDAAYAGSFVFSDRLRARLNGIERSDSIAIDFHKLGWQPISCGVVLVDDRRKLHSISVEAVYLNPADDDEAGLINLVDLSIATSRRFDALKVLITFLTLGREQLGDMVERTLALTASFADLVRDDDRFELAAEPETGMAIFRYTGNVQDSALNRLGELNAQLRRNLLTSGEAVVGRTTFQGETYLRVTLLKPTTTVEDLRDLLHVIAEMGQALEGQYSARS